MKRGGRGFFSAWAWASMDLRASEDFQTGVQVSFDIENAKLHAGQYSDKFKLLEDEKNRFEYRIPVPPLQPGDRLSFYLWNKDKRAEFFLDDVFMRVSAVKPY